MSGLHQTREGDAAQCGMCRRAITYVLREEAGRSFLRWEHSEPLVGEAHPWVCHRPTTERERLEFGPTFGAAEVWGFVRPGEDRAHGL